MVHALIQPALETYSDYLAFAAPRELGFEIIDFALPEVLNRDYSDVICEYEKKPAHLIELIVSQHGAALDLYINSRDKLIREVSEKRLTDNLEISDRLGIQFTVFHSGLIPLIGHKSYYDQWVKMHSAFWSAALAKHKTTVVLENLWDTGPEHLKEVIENVGSERLGVCFDTGHHNLFSKVPVKEWFRKFGPKISYIHVNDNLGDIDSELPAGKGSINWLEFNDAVLEFLDKPLVVFANSSLSDIEEAIYFFEKNRIYPYN